MLLFDLIFFFFFYLFIFYLFYFIFFLVRSFGTEDRPSTKQIQPRSEVYEFIIFRASDIKDLNVSEIPEQHQPPQDPAILSAVSGLTINGLYLEI